MTNPAEIESFLRRHLDSVFADDVAAYHATTADELTLYEWFVTPHRIDGLPFHDFQMSEAARRGGIFNDIGGEDSHYRYDLANLKIQQYGEVAVCTFTLLVSKGDGMSVTVESHHETRVIARVGDGLKVVHVHKSPAWKAPYQPPR